ncbi:MAG: DNA polymerase III subunit beta [Planctomycetales bacterium]
MKILCPRGTLTAAMQTVSAVVPARTPKEILKNVKLEAQGGQAVLIGTDQEVGIRYQITAADVQAPGEILLPTNRVLAILRELQGETVVVEATAEGTWIRADRAEYKLGCESAAEFPTVAGFGDQPCHKVAAGALRQMIRRTLFATDTESTRYALGGVLLELRDGTITLAATDTRRLAVVKGPSLTSGEVSGENPAPVIPSKALSLIERSLGNDDEAVEIAVRQNDVLVKTSHATIYSRLVEGRFPRYQDVIPARCDVRLELVTGPFYAAVRQAQIVTSEESRGVDFQFSPGLLTLCSRAANIGESKVELPISYDGPPLSITFDPRYVAELLRVLEPEQPIGLELTDSESAALFRTEDGYIYIVMPLSRDR